MSKRPTVKEVDITEFWDGPHGSTGKTTVTIHRLTFGETQDLQDEAMELMSGMNKDNSRSKAGARRSTPKFGVAKILVLTKAILTAPFDVTYEGVRNLDPDVAEYLYKEVEALNALDPKARPASETMPSMESSLEKT